MKDVFTDDYISLLDASGYDSTNSGIADISTALNIIFNTDKKYLNAVKRLDGIKGRKEQYALRFDLDNYEDVRVRYNIALNDIIKKVQNKSKMHPYAKKAAIDYINSIIEMNKKRIPIRDINKLLDK